MSKAKKILDFFEFLYINIAETFLLAVFVFSFCSFVWADWHGSIFYTFIGGFCAFWSMLFVNLHTDELRKEKKQMRVYSIFGIIILALAMVSIFFVGEKMTNDYVPFELFLTTY